MPAGVTPRCANSHAYPCLFYSPPFLRSTGPVLGPVAPTAQGLAMSVRGGALPLRDLLEALAVVVLWGVTFVAMRWGLDSFTPFQLGAARYVFAALPLVFLVRMPRLHWGWVLMFGLFQGVGQFGFLFFALQLGMTTAMASVLMQTQVFFTALFGFGLLRERPGRALILGLLLAGLGLLCFGMGARGAQSGGTTALGLLLTLCAAASMAASNIISRLAQRAAPGYDPLAFVVWSSFVPILPFVMLSAVTDPDASRWLQPAAWTALPPVAWLSLAYLGWISTVMGFSLWTGLLKRHPANRVAPFSLGVPVVGIAAGLLVLGESVSAWQWAGVACVVLALACVMLGPRWLARLEDAPPAAL